MGSALARQLSEKHQVIIGSRDRERAKAAAAPIGALWGNYVEASEKAEGAVFSLPFSAIGEAKSLVVPLAGKLVLSMMNPMELRDGLLEYGLTEGSAAEMLSEILVKSRIATAFNNIPVASLRSPAFPPMDILIAAQSVQAFEEAAEIVRSVPEFRPMYVGPLSQAQMVERITPLVLNLAKLNKTGSLGTRFVSQKG